MKNTTLDFFIKRNYKKIPKNLINDIISIIASLFAVTFSLSLVREIHKFISDPFIIIFLSLFLILFVLYNEYRKVIELRRFFTKKIHSKLIIIVTWTIAVSLALLGVNLWTDNSMENKISNEKQSSINNISISSYYTFKIDSINKVKITENPEYIRLNKDLSFWKTRSAATVEERQEIRNEIKNIQNQLSSLNDNFVKEKQKSVDNINDLKQIEINSSSINYEGQNKVINKSKRISFIFSILVFIVEVVIITLAKEHGNIEKRIKNIYSEEIVDKFLVQYKVLTDILSRKKKIEINDVKYSPYLFCKKSGDIFPEGEWEEIKKIFGLFKELKITHLPLKDAQNKLKSYYENIIDL